LASALSKVTSSVKGRSSRSGIVRAALAITALTAVVRLASVGKELIVASRFGTSDDLDAFLISLLVPIALVSIVSGSFNASFIPVYIQVREDLGKEAARLLFQRALGWGLVLLVLAAAAIIVAGPFYLPLIGSGFSSAKLQLTFSLLLRNVPVVMLGGLGAFLAAGLNAERRFAIPAITPFATPAMTILFLWIAPSWRSIALTWGLISGATLELIILSIALKLSGFSLRPRWHRLDPNLKRVASQFLPAVSGSILTSGNYVVDQAMAAMLSAGSVAALTYGNRMVQLPLTLAATALGTAFLPYFSELVAHQRWRELRAFVDRGLALVGLVSLPLALALFLFSEPLVRVLFGRGAFTANDVKLVGRVQSFYALPIPFYLVSILVVRLISAVQRNRLLLWASAINLIINVTLNYVLMRWIGVAGIALSTTLVYIFASGYCYIAIMRQVSRRSSVDGKC